MKLFLQQHFTDQTKANLRKKFKRSFSLRKCKKFYYHYKLMWRKSINPSMMFKTSSSHHLENFFMVMLWFTPFFSLFLSMSLSLSLFVVVCFALFDLLCVPSFSHSNRPSRAATTFLFTNCVALSVYERLLNGTVGKEIRRRSKFDIFLLLLFLMLLLVFFCCWSRRSECKREEKKFLF